MSNDAKFWRVRIPLFVMVAIDLWLFQKIGEKGWATAFFVAIALTLPLGVWAILLKSRRWDKATPMDRVQTETLSKYGKQLPKNRRGTGV